MKKLLNTLYVTSEDSYLTLEGENILINREEKIVARFPLHTLEDIFSFSYAGASPALMGQCAEKNINLAFFRPNGRFLARVTGETNGNVLLRRMQYRYADDFIQCFNISKNILLGKIYNSRSTIERTLRDHSMRVDSVSLKKASEELRNTLNILRESESLESLRGLEGQAASCYFGSFDELILNNKNDFFFKSRSRRPPLDKVNAMLSFTYSLLANDCASALEAVGLDSYVGFLHRDRSGRASLALDLMEEMRPSIADRFVLTLINNKVITQKDFHDRESGAVIMTDEGRKTLLQKWQERKREEITHPFLKEKISWGLVPHVQSLLMARYLRGDIEGYPPFLWK